MIFRVKKYAVICLLTIASILIFSSGQAYVLQGLHLIDLMIEQLGEEQSLYVSQELVFYRSVYPTEIESEESIEESQSLDFTETDLPAEQKIELDDQG